MGELSSRGGYGAGHEASLLPIGRFFLLNYPVRLPCLINTVAALVLSLVFTEFEYDLDPRSLTVPESQVCVRAIAIKSNALPAIQALHFVRLGVF